MTLVTPTQSGSFIAGIGLNSILWGILFKLDHVLAVFGLRIRLKEKILDWIANHVLVAFLFGEVANLSVHGITNPDSVLFATGGTLINTLMIFIVVPLRQLKRRLIPGVV
jgi:hypothetical protein